MFVTNTISQDLTNVKAVQRARFCALDIEKRHKRVPQHSNRQGVRQTDVNDSATSPDRDSSSDAASEVSSEPVFPATSESTRRKRGRNVKYARSTDKETRGKAAKESGERPSDAISDLQIGQPIEPPSQDLNVCLHTSIPTLRATC